MQCFGHVTRRSGNLTKTILQQAVDKRRSGRPRTRWTPNIKDRMELKMADCTRISKDQDKWKSLGTYITGAPMDSVASGLA